MHKTLDAYLGAEKPEEKKHIRKNNNAVKLIESLLSIWTTFIVKNSQPYDDRWPKKNLLDPLLHEAEKIASTHKLPKRIENEKFFEPIKMIPLGYCLYAGIFYTALLNVGVDYLKIPKTTPYVGLWGYRLKRGTMELSADAEHVGTYAEGGCIINNSDNIKGPLDTIYGLKKTWHLGTLARNATGGTHINNAKVALFGTGTEGGVYINHCHADQVGDVSENSVYINHGNISRFGDRIENSVLINFGTISTRTTLDGLLYLDINKINANHPIKPLLGELYKATKDRINEAELQTILKNIREAL